MMHDEAVADEASPAVDVEVSLPADGIIRVESKRLFGEPDAPLCRRFVERAFLAPQIEGVVLAPGAVPAIELQFDATHHSQRQVLEQLAAILDRRQRAGRRRACAGHRQAGAAQRLSGGAACCHRPRPARHRSLPSLRSKGDRLADRQRARRRHQAREPCPLPQVRPVRSDRARADERARSRSLRDQLAQLLGLCRVRSAPARPGADHRDPGRCTGQCRTSRAARQARPGPRHLHGLGAAGGSRAVRGTGPAAALGGVVRLHGDPELQGRLRCAVQRTAARSRCARLDRRRWGASQPLRCFRVRSSAWCLGFGRSCSRRPRTTRRS